MAKSKIRPGLLSCGVVPTCVKCGTQQPQRQRFAFTAVMATEADLKKLVEEKKINVPPPGTHWIIGRADEGVPGYTPCFTERLCDTEKEAGRHAYTLNSFCGISKEEAALIILSTLHLKETSLESQLTEAVHLLASHVGFDVNAPSDVVDFVNGLPEEFRSGLDEEDLAILQRRK